MGPPLITTSLLPVMASAERLPQASNGDDGVGVTVNHQRGHRELLQIGAEVGAAERRDAVQRRLLGGECGDVAGVVALGLADFELVARSVEKLVNSGGRHAIGEVGHHDGEVTEFARRIGWHGAGRPASAQHVEIGGDVEGNGSGGAGGQADSKLSSHALLRSSSTDTTREVSTFERTRTRPGSWRCREATSDLRGWRWLDQRRSRRRSTPPA